MYDRTIDGKEASFGVSGTLWRDALVFFDRDTGSHWSQVNGTSIHGNHEGERLEEVPSFVTTWGEWKRLHPDTLVLRPSEESRDGTPYAGYVQDPNRLGILGTANPDRRLPGKTMVLGILGSDGDAAAVPLESLEQDSFIQGRVGPTPFLAVSVARNGAAAFDRRLEGNVHDFRRRVDGLLVDVGTISLWDPEQGRAIKGPLEGKSLRRLDSLSVFWFVWAGFHPDTAVLPVPGPKTASSE